MRGMQRTSMMAALLTFLLVACAGGSGSGGSSDSSRLTAEEIAAADVSTVYEAVQRLRPRWLEVRAPRSGFSGSQTVVLVYMDRTLLGEVNELREIGTEVARSVQYMTGAQAQASLPGAGSRQLEGAIIVHTR